MQSQGNKWNSHQNGSLWFSSLPKDKLSDMGKMCVCQLDTFPVWCSCVACVSAIWWAQNSFRKGRDSGEHSRDLRSLHYGFTPNREAAAPCPGAELGSNHQHVRGDQTQPLHSQGPHFFLSWQLTQIFESTNMRKITLSRLSVGGAIKALGSATTVHQGVPVWFNHCFHNIAGARHRKLCERSDSVERTLKPTLTSVREN